MSFGEAKRIVMKNISPVESTEKVKLEDCLGRVLAQGVIATLAHPPFNRSAMDGYALRARDTFGASQFKPRIFNILGAQLAGSSSDFYVKANQCVQIATSARMPRGADAVVIVEEVAQIGEKLKQDQIYDINSYTISAIVQENGGLPFMLGIVPDDVDGLKLAMSRTRDWDMVVITGGSSVGERDLFFWVLQDLG